MKPRENLSRRDLLALGLVAGVGALVGCESKAAVARPVGAAAEQTKPSGNASGKPIVGVAEGDDAKTMMVAALAPLGGIEAFVKSGDVVVLKPNCGWQRTPDQAANTSPSAMKAIAELCKDAGASRLVLIEHTCHAPDPCFEMSGLAEVMNEVGGEVISLDREGMYRPLDLPKGKVLTKATVAKELDKANVFINIPVPKDHSAAKLTIGLKNLMGVVWDRGAWHSSRSLDQAIADYATEVRPHLTIIDAQRIMLENGPSGPGPTREPKMIAASRDMVAADAWAATLFDMQPSDLAYLVHAQEHGLGELDLSKVDVVKA